MSNATMIWLPCVPPAELSANARRRGKVWDQRRATEQVHWACMVALRDNPPGVAYTRRTPVTLDIEVRWPPKRRFYDCDSLASLTKAHVDSLVAWGVLPDGDGPSIVTGATYRQSRAATEDAAGVAVTIRTEATA